MSLSICINVKYTLMANSSRRCARAGTHPSSVPLPNLIRSAVSVVRLTVCDSLSGWRRRRRRRRRLDLDDSNKGDVGRPPPALSLLPPSRGRGMFHSMDGRTAQLSKTLQDHRNLGATEVSIQVTFNCATASRFEESFKA